ncbi:MAG: hypothetical protein U0869_02185 [Chloroflexota bacterium]
MMPVRRPGDPGAPRTGRGIDRSRDRAVTAAGIAVAAAFLLLATLALVVPGAANGPWLPLHLALAGGASVAIAALLPFFAATLVATAPAPAAPRVAALVLVASGAALVTAGVRGGRAEVGAVGGTLYLAGAAVLLLITVRLLRGSLIARRRVFGVLYGTALGCVLAGAALSTLMLAGVPAVAGAWGTLRAAHAWLNLGGFVGLVVAATLIHFLPTVVGSRIEQGRRDLAGVGALAAGPPLIATGFITGLWLAIAAGAALVLAGTMWLVVYAVDVIRRRARWTTDPGWHTFSTGSLACAIGWLAVTWVAAALVAVVHGPGPAGWIGGAVVLPLVVGAILQLIVGSWTHLVPAVGPGSPVRHAWQRTVLGRAAVPRLAALDTGVALLVGSQVAGIAGPIPTAGALLVAMALLTSLALFARAFTGHREPAAGSGARPGTDRKPYS